MPGFTGVRSERRVRHSAPKDCMPQRRQHAVGASSFTQYDDSASPLPNVTRQDKLVSACLDGILPAVKASIAGGASVNDLGKNKYGGVYAPLTAAVTYQHADVVHYLLSRGADAKGRDVMTAAVGNSTPAILQLLIDAGGDLNVAHGLSIAPPLFAASLAHGDVAAKVGVLLAQPGLELVANEVMGQSPEAFASARDKPDVAAMIRAEVSGGRKGVCVRE